MLKNKNDELYIGITNDADKRLGIHNSKQGALFTKNKSDFKIVFLEEYNTLPEARKREIQLKIWRRDKKEFLIERYSKNLETRQQ
jgi:putative endonuclease